MEQKRPTQKKTIFHSMVRQVVLLPMTVMLFILLTTIGLFIFALRNIQHQMVDSYENTARIALSRINMRLEQVETEFSEYIVYNSSHEVLKSLAPGTPKEKYLKQQAEAITWMNHTADVFPEAEGVLICYRNLDLLQFRGKTKADMHSYLTDYLADEGAVYNTWLTLEQNGRGYLFNIRRYGVFCGGLWIPIQNLTDDYGFDEGYPGIVCFRDSTGGMLYPFGQPENGFSVPDDAAETVRIGNELFFRRSITDDGSGISLELLISRRKLMEATPAFMIAILVMAAISAALVPLTTLWLRRKIAAPVSAMEKGMRRVGAGHLDYRIPLPERTSGDEFDFLISRFNKMTDDLNDLEYRLYISKIAQQQTELKYISQQIRPHFILNALNIIYTCDESEFPVVKKMVLYLSEYFRYIVNLKVDFVELQQELHHIENYLKIQKERYLDRFNFIVEWEKQIEKAQIPPLLLQTFVENCVKYGMRGEGQSLICVMAGLEEGKMKISVMDTGDGFPEEVLGQLQCFLQTREQQPLLGVGLQNAVERLDSHYGRGNAEVRFFNKPSGGAAVEIFLPPVPPTKTEQELSDL